MRNGELSGKMPDAIRNSFTRLEQNLEDSSRGIENILAYLNYKCGKKDYCIIPQIRYFYLIIINGCYLEIEIQNKRTVVGSESNRMRFLSINLMCNDEFWISVAEELLDAASGKLETPNGFHRVDWTAHDSYV
jgi:hypothetical protein